MNSFKSRKISHSGGFFIQVAGALKACTKPRGEVWWRKLHGLDPWARLYAILSPGKDENLNWEGKPGWDVPSLRSAYMRSYDFGVSEGLDKCTPYMSIILLRRPDLEVF
jgi:hypothetical protein